jgi:hypothetical protein
MLTVAQAEELNQLKPIHEQATSDLAALKTQIQQEALEHVRCISKILLLIWSWYLQEIAVKRVLEESAANFSGETTKLKISLNELSEALAAKTKVDSILFHY